ncbi:metallophosphoesterase family protein [Draconibacterium halophilum]|uniref:Metallophosphoesterase family protein n=1 Tax=Draconibacterium halophilum TaxID=2706887 RepID=A0A6C0RAV7_9BACT|nr:metallophosphoesterase family protein [Draconibacterium halophilum]QIA07082.1 metallophosphoesterase family protein [Draconibacterium halophilum]
MKNKHILYSLIVAIISLQLSAFNLFAQNNLLSFNNNNQFKIVQFTDCHFYNGGEKSPEVLENIKAIMEAEKPDLVILTGDIVTGSGDNWPTLASWELLTEVLIQYKTPYAVTFGNHDDEAQISRKELLKYLSKRPYCVISDEGGDEVKGIGNYVLPIYNQNEIVEKLIYCLDSRSYSLAQNKGVDGYAWFDQSQIRWFARTNQSWLTKNQNAQSLLFFHIPLPEYKQAFDNGGFRNGVRMEDECSPKINTGMFSEMVLQGNVLGSFVGHDHNNNYVAQLFQIALCYGYFSGGNSYCDLPLNGARIILLEENKRTFTTWLRRIDGKILYEVELPYSEKK